MKTIHALHVVLALTLAGAGLPAHAQSESTEVVTLRATFSPESAAPGDTVELRVAYDVKAGWNIYGTDFEAASAFPTKIRVDAPFLEPEGKPLSPDAKTKLIEILDETHRICPGEGAFVWKHRVKPDASAGEQTASVRVDFMACNDLMCLPQATVTLRATLDVKAAGATKATAPKPKFDLILPTVGEEKPGGGLKKFDLLGIGGSTGEKITWSFEVAPKELRRGQTATLRANYELIEGWHIYAPNSESIGQITALTLESLGAELAGAPTFPKPKDKQTPDGLERTLYGKGTVSFPFRLGPDAAPGARTLKASLDFQLCDANSCLPPDVRELSVDVTVSDAPPLEVAEEPEDEAEISAPTVGGDEPSGIWWLLSAVGWALFTLLMPCTYPMIPITVSMFTKHANDDSRNPVSLALAYGGGIIVCFIVIGVVFGSVIQIFAAHWITNVVFGALFVAFALSLFGMFELSPPRFLMNLGGGAGAGGGYGSVFALGLLLVVTSFTCTAPFVGTLLATGAGRSIGEVVAGMAIFGTTMAIPFVGLALFPSRLKSMPRSGVWMNTLKITLAFVEIAAALKFFSNADMAYDSAPNLLPRELFLILWAVLAFAAGAYLFGFIELKSERKPIGPGQLVTGLGAVMFGGYCLYAVSAPSLNDIMEAIAPPPAYAQSSASTDGTKSGEKISETPWTLVKDDFEKTLARAREEGKLALINWTGVT